jgi:tRNA (guanine37-N1)-methyltransferase
MRAPRQSKPWQVTVLTLFPEMFPGPLAHSLSGKALAAGLWRLETLDMRAAAEDRHRTVDDTPFGGGAGMVLRPDVVDRTLRQACGLGPRAKPRPLAKDGRPVVYLTPRGRPLDQGQVHELADGPGVILLCGRYEGVDERVIDAWQPREVSLGDFVLSGGEPAAIALIDACLRLLPGVLGNEASGAEESFELGLLEYPQYTRPREWAGRPVPDELLSGHHERIAAWRRRQAETLTRQRRPDLWDRYRAAQAKGE